MCIDQVTDAQQGTELCQVIKFTSRHILVDTRAMT